MLALGHAKAFCTLPAVINIFKNEADGATHRKVIVLITCPTFGWE